LGDRDFRLPGIGSYMAVAIDKGDVRAMAWAIVAMTIMIVAVDQLLWRPLVAWSQRFRLEDIDTSEPPRSWVLSLLRRSPLAKKLRAARKNRVTPEATPAAVDPAALAPAPAEDRGDRFRALLTGALGVAAAVAAMAGAYELVKLLLRVPPREWL